MNMKKGFIITGVVLIVLVFLILVLIAFLETRTTTIPMNSTANISKANTSNQETNTTEEPQEDNTVSPNEEEPGSIEYVQTTDGGKIPVPEGFEYIEGEIQSGAVIRDENGNEFVWIPIEDFYEEYVRENFVYIPEDEDIKEEEIPTLEDTTLDDSQDYNIDYDDSVRNYGGFYIGRYEAGNEDSKVVTKKDAIVYTGITWQEANSLAKGMYPGNSIYQSDMVSSYAWDSVCIWIRNSGGNIYDTTGYGNYSDNIDSQSEVVRAGSNDNWRINNIYDMAGNAWEYTTEVIGVSEKYHIGRGGGYWNSGAEYPIASRATSDNDQANIAVGFRVVLYLK